MTARAARYLAERGRLPSATNVELVTPGHFRVLADPHLPDLVLRAVRG